jgi:hypothetical protein
MPPRMTALGSAQRTRDRHIGRPRAGERLVSPRRRLARNCPRIRQHYRVVRGRSRSGDIAVRSPASRAIGRFATSLGPLDFPVCRNVR